MKVVAPKKMSGELFVSPVTRLLAPEMKLTDLPSPLIDGELLLLFAGAGDVPAGWLTSTIPTVQVVVVPDTVTFVPVQVFRT